MLCQLVFQPVIRLIQIVVSVVEYILVQLCQLIQEAVNVVTQVLEWLCNSVVQTVCNAVCSVICGICDFFCGIFGCDCGCENVCNNVCGVVTNIICAWTYVLQVVVQFITRLVCNYIVQAIIQLLNLIEAIVTMILTWVCTLIDIVIRWFLCWTYLAEIFNNTDPRRFRVAPKIIRNNDGYSDWFVYVNNANADGAADQNVRGYILSDSGKPLAPIVDAASGAISYYEVATRGNLITGHFIREQGGGYVPGRPLLYYPYKVMEIASHLFSDIFASAPADDGTGTDFHKNLLTYNPNVQAWLAGDAILASNNYNDWNNKYTNKASQDYFGDRSLPDMGMRVDTDSTCSHPTNTSLNLVNGEIEFTPPNTAVAENMKCGSGQTLTFDETNFLLLNKDGDTSAVTTFFVSEYNMDDSSVGCNDLLGYTIVTFRGSRKLVFVQKAVLPFEADTNRMMALVVENISAANQNIVRVAETYLHECGHQCGLLHDSDKPNCENDTTLHISKVMDPSGNIRRAYTRLQWCMIRLSPYVTSSDLAAFVQAPELPDSETQPPQPPR
ncbi:MAG TPA: hypothetical protein VKS22_07315 [Candidatus Binataceae bacterium]|nr:hypothetical protein [Candidatus Binataceae bacterium]